MDLCLRKFTRAKVWRMNWSGVRLRGEPAKGLLQPLQ